MLETTYASKLCISSVAQEIYNKRKFLFYLQDAAVKQIDVPSFSGSFGILPNHVPSLAVLKPGVVTVFENDGAVKKFFVSSGSVTINEDATVQILAEEAHPLEDLVIKLKL